MNEDVEIKKAKMVREKLIEINTKNRGERCYGNGCQGQIENFEKVGCRIFLRILFHYVGILMRIFILLSFSLFSETEFLGSRHV